MKKPLLVLILLCSLLIISNSSLCRPLGPTSLIQTGIVTFATSSPNTRRYCGQDFILYDVPPSGFMSAASVVNFGNYSFVASVDYLVSSRMKDGVNNVIVITLLIDQTWANIRVAYIAHSRKDLFVGSVLLDSTSSYDSTGTAQQIIRSNTVIPTWSPQNVKAPVTFLGIFLSGLRACSMKSPIVLGAVADNDTGLILVSATVNPDAQIEVIQVMYVLNQNPKISIQWVVGSSLGGDIRLPTIMGVHNGRPQLSTLLFSNNKLPCSGPACTANVVDPRLCGNIKGKIVEGQCIICSDPFVFDKNTNQCGCANKGYLLDQVCTPCWDNASPNILLSDCDCNTGFYMSAAKTCTPGVMPDCLNGTLNFATQKCECSKDFLVFDTFYGCICGKQPQIYDPKLDQCVDVVDICINGVLDAVTGVCNCLYSFLKYVDKVIGCACEDPLRSFDVLTQACVLNPCMNGTVNPVDPNLCDCPQPFLFFQPKVGCICDKFALTYFDPSKKVCVKNCFNGTLSPTDPNLCSCTPSLLKFIDGVGCNCPDPTQFFDVVTQACLSSKCLNGIIDPKNPTVCICIFSFLIYDILKGCICIDVTLTFSATYSQCIPNCLNGTNNKINPTQCDCPFPQLTFFVGIGCVCPLSGYFFDKITKSCILAPCLNGTVYPLDTTKCYCQNPQLQFVLKVGCTCINTLQYYDPVSQKCIDSPCKNGTLSPTGICTCIQVFLIYNVQFGCICPLNSNFIYDPINQRCTPVCLNGTIDVNDPRKCTCSSRDLIFVVNVGCICANNGQYFSKLLKKCMNRPCLNGTDTGSECTCNNVVLRYDIDFGCICIAENTWYDPTLGSCRQNCRNGTANPFNPVLCICVSDIVLIFNPVFGCVCPLLNQFYDPKSRMCVNIPKCLNGTVTPTGCGCPYLFLAFDPIKGCTCVNNALYFAPKLGACIRNCLNGTMSHLNNEECECPAEYPLTFLEDVGCVCQDLSLYFDSGTKMCKPKPCLNGTLNKISKQCQCSQIYLKYDTEKGCVCTNVQTFYSPSYKKCLFFCFNATFNISAPSNCQCSIKGTYFVSGFGCLCINPGQYFNVVSQTCVGLIDCINGTLNQPGTGCVCILTFLVFNPVKGCVCGNPATVFNPRTQNCVPNCLNGTLDPTGTYCTCSMNYLKFVTDVGCVCKNTVQYYCADLGQCVYGFCLNGTAVPGNPSLCYCQNPLLVFMTTVGCVCPDKQSYYDCATNRCVQVVNPCPNGYSHPTIPNSCQCNFPFLVFMQGQGCVCPLSMNNAIFQISTSTCVCTAPNTYMCNYVCVQCWTFSTPNSQQTGCVCIEGYTNVGNSCIQKQNCFNGTLNVVTGQCYCLNQAMYFVYSVGCICKDKNAYYSASVGLCVCLPNYYMLNGMCTLCWANSVVSIDMTTCICGPGFTAVLNTCVSITQCFNATLNQQTGRCYCQNPALTFQDKIGCVCKDQYATYSISMSMCVCITNYYSSGGVCTKCGDNSVPSADQAKCVCIQGYVLIKNTCVMQVQTCLNGTLNEQTGLCYCTYIGTYFVTSVGCVCRDSFAYFSTLTRMCVCIAGYYYSNGACTKCWDMSTPSNDLSTCLCIQGYVAVGLTCVIQNINCYNGTLNKDTGICYCTAAGTSFVAKVGCLCRDPKSTFDPNSNYCICPANFYISKGLCTQCGPNSVPTVDLTGCKCLLGYTQVESICVTEQQNCHNGTLNPNTGICYCTVVGMKFVATVGCVCRDSKMMYNVQLNICACITSYYIFEGACKPCWDNSISADDFTTCVCIKGYILSGKSCIRPNINCYNGTLDLDTLTCKCDYSFTRFVDKIGCVCRDPFSYFSLAVKNCVCIPGYYLAEVCTKCWLNASPSPDITTCLCDPGYFASSKSCINIQQNCFNGTFNPTTNTCYCPIFGMQFVPLIGCLCKDPNAYFSSILNICTCNPGYYYLNQVCTKCWDKSQPSQDLSTCTCISGYRAIGRCCVLALNCLNGTFNQQTGTCYCPYPNMNFLTNLGCVCKDSNYYFNSQAKACFCNQLSYFLNGFCTACGHNSIPSPDKSSCVCKKGFVMVNSICINLPDCLNGTANPYTGVCTCQYPFLFYDYRYGCLCKNPLSFFSQALFSCVCNSESYYRNGQCTKCWLNSSPTNDQSTCKCDSGFMQIGNRCIDNPGCMNGTLNSITGKCECNSPSLQFHDNIGCICIDSNSIFDPTTQSCVCTGNNYKLNDKCTPCWQHSIVSVTKLSCVCINNYVLNQQGNGCIPAGCTGTAIYNIVTGQCQCGNGFTYSATLGCVCNGQNQMFNVFTGTCTCNWQSFLLGGKCVPCPQNSSPTQDFSQCTCNSGYRMSANGQCIPSYACLPMSNWDSNLGTCVCVLQIMVYNASGCFCPNNQAYNSITNKCNCNSDSIVSGSTCVSCGGNSFPNPSQTACVCRNEYYPNPNGLGCLQKPNCPSNSQFNPSLGTCVCLISGQKYINGICSCPPNMIVNYQLQKCTCDSNSYFSNDNCFTCWANSSPRGSQSICDCNPGYRLSGPRTCSQIQTCIPPAYYNTVQNVCVCLISIQIYSQTLGCQCPQNMVFNVLQNNCVCAPGYYAAGMQCLICWSNSVVASNGTWCVCNVGFYASSSMVCSQVQGCISPAIFNTAQGVCVCLSSDQSYSNTQGCSCTVANKEIVNGVCRCTSLFYTSNNVCVSCWKYSIADSGSTTCVCKQNYYPSGPQSCSEIPTCPQYSKWMGTACQCTIPQMQMIYGICTCPNNMVVDILKMSCVCDTMSYWNGMACVICWPNSVRSSDGSTCKCLLNYIVGPTPNSCVAMKTCIGGFPYDYTINKCVCGANQEYDQVTGCRCTLPSQVLYGAFCICASNAYLSEGKCVLCWQNSSPDKHQTTCICDTNYYSPSFGICLQLPNCPGQSIWNSNANKCTCISPSLTMGPDGCVCPANQVYSTITGTCQCNSQSYASQTNPLLICIACWSDSIPFQNGCRCKPGYYQPVSQQACLRIPICVSAMAFLNMQTYQCECPNGYNYDPYQGCMSATCPINQIWSPSQRQCVCILSIMIYSSTGCICPTNMVYSAATNNCVCDYRSYPVGNVCLPCWENSTPTINGATCTCNQNYIQVGATCVKRQKCISPATYNYNTNRCECNYNQLYSETLGCQCSGANQVVNTLTGQCMCNQNSYLAASNSCERCWLNSVPTSNQKSCQCLPNYYSPQPGTCNKIPFCVQLAIFDLATSQCVCKYPNMQMTGTGCVCYANMLFSKLLNRCVCNSNSYPISQTACQQCWMNSVLAHNQLTCICINGFVPSPIRPQTCVQQCVGTAILNPLTNICQCPSGSYDPVNGCTCSGPHQIFNALLKKCQCDSYFYQSGTNCIPCWPGSQATANQLNCECITGYYLSSINTCTQIPSCPPLSQWNLTITQCVCIVSNMQMGTNGCQCSLNMVIAPSGIECVCDMNSFLSLMGCVRCPENSSPSTDQSTCYCNTGFIQQGSVCVASSTCYFGAIYNNTLQMCVCINTALVYSPSSGCGCPNPTQMWDSVSKQCACPTNTYLVGDQCSTCWPNSELSPSGTECVCLPGFTIAIAGVYCSPICLGQSSWDLQASACVCANTALAYDCNLGCVCPLNMMLNSLTAGGKCVCDRYSLLIGTTCTRCPQGMQADYLRVRCIPALGYYLASSGNIAKIPICSLFAYFNEQTQTCQCFLPVDPNNNDGCACSNIFTYDSSDARSCFIAAILTSYRVLPGCTTNTVIVNSATTVLTIMGAYSGKNDVKMRFCGKGIILLIKVTQCPACPDSFQISSVTDTSSTATNKYQGVKFDGCFNLTLQRSMSNIGNVTIELGSGAIISNVVSNLLKGSREKLMLPLSVATAPDNNSTMAVQSAPEQKKKNEQV